MRRTPFPRILGTLLLSMMVFASAFAMGLHSAPSAKAAPEIDPTWANGVVVNMIGPHLMTNPSANLLANADELYLLSFPEDTSCAPNCGPITLPSGYKPQCDPCFHPGLPVPFVYHDHVITGAPGFGTNGTAGSFKGPWKVIVLMYAPAFAFSQNFKPVTSDEALDTAEAAGDFLPIAQGINPDNQFEIPTGLVLICPIVSAQA